MLEASSLMFLLFCRNG